MDVYIYYIKGGGTFLFSLAALLLATSVIFSTLANFTIMAWSEEEQEQAEEEGEEGGGLSTSRNLHYVNLYATLALMEVVCMVTMWLVRMLATQTGARYFHYHLADIMLRAPISFYDVTPLGRVLTLFSNDLRSMNVMLFAQVSWLPLSLVILVVEASFLCLLTSSLSLSSSPSLPLLLSLSLSLSL